MADQWYYSSGGQQLGPVDWDKLQGLATSGKLQRADMVWKDGMPDWKPASGIDGLTFAVGPAPAPAPGPAPFGGPPAAPQYGYPRQGSPFFSKIGLDGILAASGALAMLLGTFLPWLSNGESLFGLDGISQAQILFIIGIGAIAVVAVKAFVKSNPLSRTDALSYAIHLTWIGGASLLMALVFVIGKGPFNIGGGDGPDISFGPFFSLIGAGVLLAGGIIALVKAVAMRA